MAATAANADPSKSLQGVVDATLTVVLMVSSVVILLDSIYHWYVRLRAKY